MFFKRLIISFFTISQIIKCVKSVTPINHDNMQWLAKWSINENYCFIENTESDNWKCFNTIPIITPKSKQIALSYTAVCGERSGVIFKLTKPINNTVEIDMKKIVIHTIWNLKIEDFYKKSSKQLSTPNYKKLHDITKGNNDYFKDLYLFNAKINNAPTNVYKEINKGINVAKDAKGGGYSGAFKAALGLLDYALDKVIKTIFVPQWLTRCDYSTSLNGLTPSILEKQDYRKDLTPLDSDAEWNKDCLSSAARENCVISRGKYEYDNRVKTPFW